MIEEKWKVDKFLGLDIEEAIEESGKPRRCYEFRILNKRLLLTLNGLPNSTHQGNSIS